MGSILITIDKNEVMGKLTDTSSNMSSEFQRLVNDIKEVVGVNLSIEAPVGCTHNLVTSNMIIDTGLFDFYTDNSADYYPFVVLGTSSHPINSPVFICSIGEWRYMTDHPGTMPNDFPSRAADDSEGEILSRAEEFVSWIVN